MTYTIFEWLPRIPGQHDIDTHFSLYVLDRSLGYILVHWCDQDITLWPTRESVARAVAEAVAEDRWHFADIKPQRSKK